VCRELVEGGILGLLEVSLGEDDFDGDIFKVPIGFMNMPFLIHCSEMRYNYKLAKTNQSS
jgi:hypothetical protein